MADDEVSKNDQVPDTKLEALLDVKVEISAVLGTAIMPIAQILKLGRGAVVELNRTVDEDIEVHANNRLVAHGEVVVVDGNLGVNLTKTIQLSDVVIGKNKTSSLIKTLDSKNEDISEDTEEISDDSDKTLDGAKETLNSAEQN